MSVFVLERLGAKKSISGNVAYLDETRMSPKTSENAGGANGSRGEKGYRSWEWLSAYVPCLPPRLTRSELLTSFVLLPSSPLHPKLPLLVANSHFVFIAFCNVGSSLLVIPR